MKLPLFSSAFAQSDGHADRQLEFFPFELNAQRI